jgi:hypothetical protein
MAEVVGLINTSHGPFTTLAPEQWEETRLRRSYRDDVPVESMDERVAKAARAAKGLAVLGEQLATMAPDVLVVFGDDQFECFDFSNFPALSIFVGEHFLGRSRASGEIEKIPVPSELATAVLTGLLRRGFDPAFSTEQPKPERGMCHAIMNPINYWSTWEIPTIPVLLNGYFPPQAPAVRCYEVGRAIREVIDAFPADLRVVVIGSGGLWHTPGRTSSYLNEEFDHAQLEYLARGDIAGMAAHFDRYAVPDSDASQDLHGRGMTGLPTLGGPQMGTREICNWIGAAAVADGRPWEIVDYIPIYASPIGTAFAYCTDV